MKLEDFGFNKEDVLELVTDKIVEQLYDEVREYAMKSCTKAIDKKINSSIDEIINSQAQKTFEGVYQPINQWGEPTGKPTTIKDHFAKSCQEWWLTKVDSNGKLTDYYRDQTRAEYLVKSTISGVFKEKLSTEMDKILNESKKQVADAWTHIFAELVKRKFDK